MNAHEPFASFDVCGHCYELHGPFDYTWKNTHYTFVQECRCRRDAPPADPRPPTWVSFDFNTGAELCRGCGIEVLPSGSRWAIWFCDACLTSAVKRNHHAGIAVVPIGRHSLMHGVGMSNPSAPSQPEIERFISRFGNLTDRIQLLDDWSHEVVRRNLANAGLDRHATVTLTHYLAATAKVDRAERFATMLKWLTHHAKQRT